MRLTKQQFLNRMWQFNEAFILSGHYVKPKNTLIICVLLAPAIIIGETYSFEKVSQQSGKFLGIAFLVIFVLALVRVGLSLKNSARKFVAFKLALKLPCKRRVIVRNPDFVQI